MLGIAIIELFSPNITRFYHNFRILHEEETRKKIFTYMNREVSKALLNQFLMVL